MEISTKGAGSMEAAEVEDRGDVVEQAARKSKAAGHAARNNEQCIGIGCKYRWAQAWQTPEYRA
ncbi:MAG: hypothetical protein ACREO7_06475 [Pseudoxanthomonas sp.]